MGPIFFSGPRGNPRARLAWRSRLERRESTRGARADPAAIAPRWAAPLGFRLAQRCCCAYAGARGSPRRAARPRVGPPAALRLFRPLCCCAATTKRAECGAAAKPAVSARLSFCVLSVFCFLMRRDSLGVGSGPCWAGPASRRASVRLDVGSLRRAPQALLRPLARWARSPMRGKRGVRSVKPPAAATFDAVFGTCGQPAPRRAHVKSTSARGGCATRAPTLCFNVNANVASSWSVKRPAAGCRQTVKRPRRPAAGFGIGGF